MPTAPRPKAASSSVAAELPARDASERTRSEEILEEQARELAAANQRKSQFLVMLGRLPAATTRVRAVLACDQMS